MKNIAIIIPTKNRTAELRRALSSCVIQDIDLDIIVLDDGSEDGTVDMVQDEFPNVILIKGEISKRQMYRRNQGAALSNADYLVFIDDDCVFPSADIVRETVEKFDSPWVGAVAIPYVNIRKDNCIHQKAPTPELNYVIPEASEGAFVVRRDVFLSCGGFNTSYQREQEGSELAIRMIDKGYLIRAGHSAPLHHIHSTVRDNKLSHIFGPRNLIFFAWLCVPFRWLFLQIAGSTHHVLWHGIKIRRPVLKIIGLIRGYFTCVRYFNARSPVSARAYMVYRYLRANNPAAESTILKMLDIR